MSKLKHLCRHLEGSVVNIKGFQISGVYYNNSAPQVYLSASELLRIGKYVKVPVALSLSGQVYGQSCGHIADMGAERSVCGFIFISSRVRC